MKKILIVNNNMHIGGVQKALINLLWNIRDHYDVTLLLFAGVGGYMDQLPPGIRVETVSSGYRYLGMTRHDTRTPGQRLGRAFYAAVCRLLGRRFAITLMGLNQTQLTGYDAAISYLHNSSSKMFYGGCNDFVLRHVSAAQKITFLHCDYANCGAATAENSQQYARFDTIAACSEGCADSFLRAEPQLRDKVRVVRNCHRADELYALAESAGISLPEEKVNLVTVARLGREKGVERALRAIAALERPLREKLHYYIIGDGIQRPLLLQLMEQHDLSSCVTLCGTMVNPYGYIRAADLLLIPSYTEAAPLVIGEAALLGTPVLSTRTSSADEMIVRPGLGWVCDNDEGALAAALAKLLANSDCLKNAPGLRTVPEDNAQALEQFHALFS